MVGVASDFDKAVDFLIDKDLLDEDTKKYLISYQENSFGFDGLTSNYNESFDIFGQEVVYDKETSIDSIKNALDSLITINGAIRTIIYKITYIFAALNVKK